MTRDEEELTRLHAARNVIESGKAKDAEPMTWRFVDEPDASGNNDRHVESIEVNIPLDILAVEIDVRITELSRRIARDLRRKAREIENGR